MLRRTSLLKTALRRCGVELKRAAFGLDLGEDLKALHRSAPISTIVDVGANEGQSVEAFRALFPRARILSIEPASGPFVVLQRKFAGQPGVTLVQAALGETEGSARLRVTGASVNASLLPYDKPTGEDEIRAEEVTPVRTLESVCAEHGFDRIDLLKIDTQGYDLHVLQGAAALLREHRVRCVLTEIICVQMYQGQAWFHEIVAHLAGLGIQFSGLYCVNREDDRFIHWADALFIDPAFA